MFMLVGDQTLPNLIPFLQAGETYRRVVLVSTPAPAIRQAVDYLRFFLTRYGLAESAVINCEADGYDLELTLAVCRRTLDELAASEPDFSPVFNMTGGTKIMALAAYQLALETGGRLLYLDSGQDRLLELLPTQRVQPLQVQLNVADYLAAHGYDSLHDRSRASEPVRQAARHLALANPATVSRLAKLLNTAPRRPLLAQADEETRQLALDLEGLLWRLKPDEADANAPWQLEQLAEPDFFPGGGWLERYAFDCAVAVGEPLCDVRGGLSIRRETENELDLAFTWKHHLAIASCKTGIKPESAWLYDLNDRGRRLGSFARKILIVNMDTQPATEFRKRAAQDNIWLLDATALPHLTARLAAIVRA